MLDFLKDIRLTARENINLSAAMCHSVRLQREKLLELIELPDLEAKYERAGWVVDNLRRRLSRVKSMRAARPYRSRPGKPFQTRRKAVVTRLKTAIVARKVEADALSLAHSFLWLEASQNRTQNT
jgi:hypothetical protein